VLHLYCFVQADEVLQWCQERPLTLEVHDRTAIPEPPEFPVTAPARSDLTESSPQELNPEAPVKPSGKQGTRKEQEAAAAAAAAAAVAAEAAAVAKAAAEAKVGEGGRKDVHECNLWQAGSCKCCGTPV